MTGVHFIRLIGKPTNDELQAYLDAERVRVMREEEQALLMVLELKEVWTSVQRKMMRDFELEMTEKAVGRSLGMAIVIPNSFIRGAFTAYYWLAPPTYPTKMVPSAEGAYEWVAEQLVAAGLPCPKRDEYVEAADDYWTARQAVPGKGLVPLSRQEFETKAAS